MLVFLLITFCAAFAPETIRLYLKQEFFNDFASEFLKPLL